VQPGFPGFLYRHRTVLIQLACWLLYIVYEQSAILISGGRLNRLPVNLYYYGVNIGLYYCHAWLLNKTAGRAKPAYALAVLLGLAELAAFELPKLAGNYFFYQLTTLNEQSLIQMIAYDVYRSLYFLGLSTLIWSAFHLELFRRNAAAAERRELLADRDRALAEARLSEAENAYYQHQLNPHLLLNTLSFIYSSVYPHSAAAAEGVLLLADVFRFSLSPSDEQGMVGLSDEIEQVFNLLEINRLRYGREELQVQFSLTGDTGGFRIIPLILLTLTENLFKHGLVNDPARPAQLGIALSADGLLSYRLTNQKKHRQETEGRHLGLKNIRIRLEQAYPGAYTLDIKETEASYALQLTLKL
jgi:hypothetical protein